VTRRCESRSPIPLAVSHLEQDTTAIPQAHGQRQDTGRVGSGNMKVSRKISDAILKKMKYTFNPEEFHMGMNVEMEHQDVTNGNVVKTAKIAAAHLTENPKYYTLLKKYVEK
jgi:hypothetical protein